MNNKTQDGKILERKCANCEEMIIFNPQNSQYLCNNCQQKSNELWDQTRKQRWNQMLHYKQGTRKNKISLSFPVQFFFGFFGWFIFFTILFGGIYPFMPMELGVILLFILDLAAIIAIVIAIVFICISAIRKSLSTSGIPIGIITATIINSIIWLVGEGFYFFLIGVPFYIPFFYRDF